MLLLHNNVHARHLTAAKKREQCVIYALRFIHISSPDQRADAESAAQSRPSTPSKQSLAVDQTEQQARRLSQARPHNNSTCNTTPIQA